MLREYYVGTRKGVYCRTHSHIILVPLLRCVCVMCFSFRKKNKKGSNDMAVMQKPRQAFILDSKKANDFF